MREKKRILGIYHPADDRWNKLIYLHRSAEGGACLNGMPGTIALAAPGADIAGYPADVVLVVPAHQDDEGEFIAVNDGECLLRREGAALEVCTAGFVGVSAPVDFWRPIRTGILTVSDKGARGEREDTAGPALADLAETLGAVVCRRDVVPDDRAKIAAVLAEWTDKDGLNLILTTGGTGFAPRDVTPEALMDVHDRAVPGIGEAMRARSALHTPRACLTRSVAVLRRSTLIIAFPGSERAVRECFEAIAPALRHGIDMAQKWDSECADGGHR